MGLFSAPKLITVRHRSGSKSGSSVASSSSSGKRSHRSSSSSSSTAPSSASSSSSSSRASKHSSSSSRHSAADGRSHADDFDYEAHKRDEARRAHRLAKRLEEKERESQLRSEQQRLKPDLVVQPEYLNPSQFAHDQWSRHRGLNESYYGNMGSSSRTSDHSSSTSAYKRRPREGFIKALLHKLRKLLRKLLKFVKRHPFKIFFWLLLPLISGGFIVSFFRRFDIKMPALVTMALAGLNKTLTSKQARRALNGAGLKDFDFSEGASLSTVLKVVRHLV